jgi:hypothetical protein
METDVGESGCGLIWDTIPKSAWMDKNQISKPDICERLFLARDFKSSTSEYEAWELLIRPLLSVGLR